MGCGCCKLCPDTALGHHAGTCRHEGDVAIYPNCMWDVVADLCCHANMMNSLCGEGSWHITRDHTTPADILIAGRDRGKPAILDITITSPLLCHLG